VQCSKSGATHQKQVHRTGAGGWDVAKLDVMVESRVAVGEDGAVLAAALTAALVEYRSYVQEQCEHNSSEGVGASWRMVACWERLRGGI
jgi:hypothetical protein